MENEKNILRYAKHQLLKSAEEYEDKRMFGLRIRHGHKFRKALIALMAEYKKLIDAKVPALDQIIAYFETRQRYNRIQESAGSIRAARALQKNL